MWIEGASPNAPGHDLIMLWINIICIVSFLIVNGVLVYFIVRYRRRGDDDQTSPIAHSTTLELVWTIVPSIVFVILFVWGLVAFINLRTIPEDAREVAVDARQWGWDFTYPAELRQNPEKATMLRSTNVLYLEEGVPVKMVMTSADVLHSFFVPAFRVKEDIVPNFYTYATFTPLITEAQMQKDRTALRAQSEHPEYGKHPVLKQYCEDGTRCAQYDMFCTEYCGKDHSFMDAAVVVLPTEAFRAKMAEIEQEAGNISPERGRQIWDSNCKSCHSLDGTAVVGPSFQGLWGSEVPLESGETVPADANYIKTSILYPNEQLHQGYPAIMPAQNLNDAEISSIIELLKEYQ